MTTTKPHRAEPFIQRLENEQRARLRLVTNERAEPAPTPQAEPVRLSTPIRTGFKLTLGVMAAHLAAFVALVALLMLIARTIR